MKSRSPKSLGSVPSNSEKPAKPSRSANASIEPRKLIHTVDGPASLHTGSLRNDSTLPPSVAARFAEASTQLVSPGELISLAPIHGAVHPVPPCALSKEFVGS